MRLTLEEQEQTQVEQDQVLEAKLEEADWLATELKRWKENAKKWKPNVIKVQIKTLKIQMCFIKSSVSFKMNYRKLNKSIKLIEING